MRIRFSANWYDFSLDFEFGAESYWRRSQFHFFGILKLELKRENIKENNEKI